jgi:hypothetical protein
MDENKQNAPQEQEPVVAEEEMVMPKENPLDVVTAAAEDKAGQLGIILGVLIVVLVLILGGLYIWGSTIGAGNTVEAIPAADRPTAEENNEPESTNAEAEVETMGALSTSNEIEAIEADIESTDLDALDAELDAIDAELDAALNGL